MRLSCLALLLLVCSYHAVPAGAAAAGAAKLDAPTRFHNIVETWSTAVLRQQPETATSLAVSEERAGGPFNGRVSDLSRTGLERIATLSKALVVSLREIPRDSLPAADQVTYDVLTASAKADVDNARFGYGYYGMGAVIPYVVTQLSGAWAQMPDFIDSQQPLRNAKDVEDYLARVHGFAGMLDQETTRIGEDAKAGVTPPGFIIDGALTQLKRFAATKPADTVLVKSLKRRGASIEGAAAAAGRAETIVASEVMPALQRQIDALTALRKDASSDAGVWRLPHGDELYAAALHAWNTTTLSADEIHQLGLDIVAKNTAEMDTLLQSLGKKKGTVAERMRALSKEKSQLYPNTDAGKTQLIADLNAHVAKVTALLPRFFGVLPKAALQIKRVPAETEQGSPGGYYQSPALDGSRPGAYYINLRNTAENPKLDLPTLTHHEGIPGHHLQIAISQESVALPFARSALLGFSGYIEGWALYAEGVADEMGMYASDPYGKLGYLRAATFRATRLVVDTGLHAKHWSREQAIKYMVDALGSDPATLTTEVDRYCVWPGQATAYMVGREYIKKLRANAQEQLGDRFDVKKFHDVVLTNGAMPLSVLKGVVDTWITAEKKG